MSEKKEFNLKSYIIAKLRHAFLRYPERSKALNRSKSEYWIEGKTGNLRRVHFKCAKCGRMFNARDVAVDHISDIGRFSTWDEFITNLFCSIDNLQILCNYANKDMAQFGNVPSCHRVKCKEEAARRKEERASTL